MSFNKFGDCLRDFWSDHETRVVHTEPFAMLEANQGDILIQDRECLVCFECQEEFYRYKRFQLLHSSCHGKEIRDVDDDRDSLYCKYEMRKIVEIVPRCDHVFVKDKFFCSKTCRNESENTLPPRVMGVMDYKSFIVNEPADHGVPIPPTDYFPRQSFHQQEQEEEKRIEKMKHLFSVPLNTLKSNFNLLVKDYEDLKNSNEESIRTTQNIVDRLVGQINSLNSEKSKMSEELLAAQNERKSLLNRIQSLESLVQSVICHAAPKTELLCLKKNVEVMSKDYFEHKDRHHTIKYKVSGITTTPQLQKNRQEFVCFLGDKFEVEIEFAVISGKRSAGAIDFSPLKLQFNGRPVRDYVKMPLSVEFDLKTDRIGRNELTLEFENLKGKLIFQCLSTEVSESKSQIFLRKSGSLVPCNVLCVSDEIEVVLVLRNESGVGLPFSALEGKEFVVRVAWSGSKKSVKKIFVELEEEKYEGNGVIVGCRFRIEKEMERGKYNLSVFDKGFGKTKEFLVN